MGSSGQALVEFALVAIVLFLLIFIIIEAGRLFQSWLTVQNAARAAGRYALTGKYDTDCLTVFPACLDPRVQSIKDEARRTGAGLSIDDNAVAGTPKSFIAEVWSPDDAGEWKPDFAGRAGEPVRVRVTYHMPFIVPLFTAIIPSIGVEGQVTITNEEFEQVTSGQIYTSPPDVIEGGLDVGPPTADLKVTKLIYGNPEPSDDHDGVYAGYPLSWEIIVENLGPFDAENIVVVDTLPVDSVYQGSSVSGGGYCDGSSGSPTVTCYLPNLSGDGGTASLGYVTIDTLAPETAPSTATNTAEVSNGPATVDLETDNNISAAIANIIPWADLGVVKTDNPDPVLVSQHITYTITVHNYGLNDATGVVVTDTLPSGVSHVSDSAGCTDIDSNPRIVLRCELGNVATGDQVTATIVVEAPSSPGQIQNIVDAGSEVDDPNSGNNHEEIYTSVVIPLADLQMDKSSEHDFVQVGEEITYTLKVTNTGPNDALDVTVTDLLPTNVLFARIDQGNPECSYSAPPAEVVCSIGSLGATQSWEGSFVVTATYGSEVSNTATVTSTISDPVPTNNTAVDTVGIYNADLVVGKQGPSNVSLGTQVDYTLTITNDGPDIASDVVLTDTLPYANGLPVFTFDSSDIITGSITCSVTQANQVFVCSIGIMDPGEVIQIGFSPTVSQTGNWENVAEVKAREYDPNSGNNTAKHQIIVDGAG